MAIMLTVTQEPEHVTFPLGTDDSISLIKIIHNFKKKILKVLILCVVTTAVNSSECWTYMKL